jgi:hypothetical protein
MRLTNCTISGNEAESGGGVDHPGSGSRIVLASTTIAENSATFGGGVGQDVGRGAFVTAMNTIIGNNTATVDPDCNLRIRSRGYNLIEVCRLYSARRRGGQPDGRGPGARIAREK